MKTAGVYFSSSHHVVTMVLLQCKQREREGKREREVCKFAAAFSFASISSSVSFAFNRPSTLEIVERSTKALSRLDVSGHWTRLVTMRYWENNSPASFIAGITVAIIQRDEGIKFSCVR